MRSHWVPERCSAKGRRARSDPPLRHLPSDHAVSAAGTPRSQSVTPGSRTLVKVVQRMRRGQGTWTLQGVLNACTLVRMVTLADIEAAAVSLSPAEKQELMLFLASRLRAEGAALPEPRCFQRTRWPAGLRKMRRTCAACGSSREAVSGFERHDRRSRVGRRRVPVGVPPCRNT